LPLLIEIELDRPEAGAIMRQRHVVSDRLLQSTVRAVVNLALGKMPELSEQTEAIVRQTVESLDGCEHVAGRLGYDRPPSPQELDDVPWYVG